MAGGMKLFSRILMLLLLITVLLVGGLLWFDYLGLMNVKQIFAPASQLVGISAPEKLENDEDALLLERERLLKREEAVKLQQEALESRSGEIAEMEAEVQQKLELLEEKEKALAEQEKSFNERLKQYENRRANLRQSAEYFAGMPPQQAVDRLLEMEDQDIIDILRTSERLAQERGEGSLVAYWLSLMPSDRAAQLSRKMLKKPEG
ncbi:MAG: flagellar protein FlbB [Spirochaetia bacterium]